MVFICVLLIVRVGVTGDESSYRSYSADNLCGSNNTELDYLIN